MLKIVLSFAETNNCYAKFINDVYKFRNPTESILS